MPWSEKRREQRRNSNRLRSHLPEYRKKHRIRAWRNNDMILWDTDEIYERYEKSTNCEICDIEYTGHRTSAGKNLDHDHLSKYPRFVCCHKCNHHLQKIDNIRYKVLLELHRKFNLL